ncbi:MULTISPECIES: 2-dehydro-3-deoxygalactonokinase [unclassified Shinella]|uniref:2-dehydro-3-deoxygalactonokinase n=1 Tax=unclassified Shinella TaxID=2643062 RepID=UPI0023709F1C|nr:2-dehydro-3-deoxygalactonokinase [Shinella sp. HY16]MDC7273849.1 2-dehydro-3-deoxygalactonokinase [Shinella sp. YZ44]
MSNAALVAIDWGTTSFRLWVLDEAGKAVASVTRPCGMSRLQRGDYERILLEMLR